MKVVSYIKFIALLIINFFSLIFKFKAEALPLMAYWSRLSGKYARFVIYKKKCNCLYRGQ